MKRREFIGLTCGIAGLPFAARAQSKSPRVGYVLGSGFAASGRVFEEFREALRELGYVEGRNIELEFRSAEGRRELLPGLIEEVLRSKVDVLVAAGAPAVAARQATQTIPIVAVAPDPVRLGLAASLARPGGNVTGLSFFSVEISGKRLELLREIVPNLGRVGVVRGVGSPAQGPVWEETQAAAAKLGVQLRPLDVRAAEDFDGTLAEARAEGMQALLVFDDLVTITHKLQFVERVAESRLPAIYSYREFVQDGGLISYGPNLLEFLRRTAFFVDRILRGAKPGDLPIEQPSRLELVVNLKTANSMGLSLPPTLIARADEVIE